MLSWQKVKAWFRGPSRTKDTEAMLLKAKLHNRVEVLKEKASKGDSDASLKLGALKESLTEQSIRMNPKSGGSKPLLLVIVAVLALVAVGGCSGGLGTKTAKDIEVAVEMIAPEYLAYVEADPKLKDAQKQDRKNQVRALRDVLKAAQK